MLKALSLEEKKFPWARDGYHLAESLPDMHGTQVQSPGCIKVAWGRGSRKASCRLALAT